MYGGVQCSGIFEFLLFWSHQLRVVCWVPVMARDFDKVPTSRLMMWTVFENPLQVIFTIDIQHQNMLGSLCAVEKRVSHFLRCVARFGIYLLMAIIFVKVNGAWKNWKSFGSPIASSRILQVDEGATYDDLG